jgi:hypothetical protein
VRGTTSGRSVVLLPNNLEPAPRRCRLEDAHTTTTNAPTRARTLTPTPTAMLRCSSGGHHRTSPLRPCCCAAARRQRPLKKDECATSSRRCSKQWRCNKWRSPLCTSDRSVVEREHRPHMAQTRLPPGIRISGKGAGWWDRQSRADSGLTAMPGTPSRLADGLECR